MTLRCPTCLQEFDADGKTAKTVLEAKQPMCMYCPNGCILDRQILTRAINNAGVSLTLFNWEYE